MPPKWRIYCGEGEQDSEVNGMGEHSLNLRFDKSETTDGKGLYETEGIPMLYVSK